MKIGEGREESLQRAALIDDLLALRRGAGLSRAALESRSSLVEALGRILTRAGLPAAPIDCLALLINMAQALDGSPQSRSLRAALAISEPGSARGLLLDPGRLTGRRKSLAEELGVHPDTIENYENAKIQELAIDIEDRLAAPPPAGSGQDRSEPTRRSGGGGRSTASMH